MQSDNRKILTLSYMVTAVLTAFVVGVLMDALAATFGGVARVVSNDIVAHGLPVTIGVITFAILQFNRKVNAWADEVVVEIKKVVWPSKKDTTAMTIVVCIMLVITGIVLGTFDFLSSLFVNYLVSL
jgi:preprotein translocase subunit SecE